MTHYGTLFYFILSLSKHLQSRIKLNDSPSGIQYLLSNQDNDQCFLCRQKLNPKCLIQPSETLPIELTRTHYKVHSWFVVSCN